MDQVKEFYVQWYEQTGLTPRSWESLSDDDRQMWAERHRAHKNGEDFTIPSNLQERRAKRGHF